MFYIPPVLNDPFPRDLAEFMRDLYVAERLPKRSIYTVSQKMSRVQLTIVLTHSSV